MIVTPITGRNCVVTATITRIIGKTMTMVHSMGIRKANAIPRITSMNAKRLKKRLPVTLYVRYSRIVPISPLVFIKGPVTISIPPRHDQHDKKDRDQIPQGSE